MMENRSFDHVLGWLPGANGRQDGLSYVDKDGATHTTWPLGPDFQGCAYEDPDHTWPGIAIQYADGRCDGFLQTAKVGDKFPIGYYREHELPIWRVDFRDDANSSYYVSGSTGAILERRNDSWRWWDFFWMLHNMDYANRTSFNHPLIITVGFALAWLAVTGFWLLFRTMWRHDFVAIRRLARAGGHSLPPRAT